MNAQAKNRQRKGRKRRLTGWTLIALGLLAAGVWGASAWEAIGHRGTSVDARVVNGSFMLFVAKGGRAAEHDKATLLELLDTLVSGRGLVWRWHLWNWRLSTRGAPVAVTSVVFPLWPIPLLLWAAGVPVLRSGILARRRAVKGMCGKCGYSLAGLGEGAGCPECGTVRSGAKRMNAGSEAVRSNGPPQSSDGGTK